MRFFPPTARDPKMSAKTESLFHTSHKSFNFAVFCCWGEVIVPSEPPEKEKTKKTAKYWTIIRAQPEHCARLLKSVLRAHQLNNRYLFCSCFSGAGYLFIAFPFMVEIFVWFSSRTSFPFKVSRYTCGFSFKYFYMIYLNHHYDLLRIFYQPYHLPVHVSFEFDFSFAVTFFKRSHYTFAHLRTKTNA